MGAFRRVVAFAVPGTVYDCALGPIDDRRYGSVLAASSVSADGADGALVKASFLQRGERVGR